MKRLIGFVIAKFFFFSGSNASQKMNFKLALNLVVQKINKNWNRVITY